jgi:hypothetical protein
MSFFVLSQRQVPFRGFRGKTARATAYSKKRVVALATYSFVVKSLSMDLGARQYD